MHALAEPLATGDQIVAIVADHDRVVDLAHVGPRELAVAEVIERAAEQRVRAVDVADVVDADVPLVGRAVERVGEATGGVVALEHQHALVRVAREQAGGGEPAEPGADHDRVPAPRAGIGDAVLLVRSTDAVAHDVALRERRGLGGGRDARPGRNPASS